MKLSEIKQTLAERGIQLTRSLGQNFLHDANQLRRIVEAAELQPGERVLEIGPGLGPLTEVLLASGAEVLAIEKDERLVRVLRERFASERRFTLLHADALHHLQQANLDLAGWKVVSNLPYSVASPILVELAQSEHGPERIVATLQLEVAERLIARAGAADYGLLSLLVQLRYAPAGMFKIPAACFFPSPDVDSACVSLHRRAEPLLEARQTRSFVKIVRRSFSQRRKMMFKLLKGDWAETELHRAFAAVGLSEKIRAEAVSLEQFVQLTQTLDA